MCSFCSPGWRCSSCLRDVLLLNAKTHKGQQNLSRPFVLYLKGQSKPKARGQERTFPLHGDHGCQEGREIGASNSLVVCDDPWFGGYTIWTHSSSDHLELQPTEKKCHHCGDSATFSIRSGVLTRKESCLLPLYPAPAPFLPVPSTMPCP